MQHKIIRLLRYVLIAKLRSKRMYRKYRLCGNEFDNTVIFRPNCILVRNKWGKYSDCDSNCWIENCIIGNFVNIAHSVTIGPRNHIYTNFSSHDFVYLNKEFLFDNSESCFDGYLNKIGHDVWIGCNSTIMTGVEIGNGAVIAAGSIVTKSVPKYAIVGGNPARFIKWRFSQEQIDKLESTRWYEWDIELIKARKDELESIVLFDIEQFKRDYFSQKAMISTERVYIHDKEIDI